MKKLMTMTLAFLVADMANSMPTKQEISEVRPLVAELMSPAMSDYKARRKSSVEVADTAMAFAESAKSEATRCLFLTGAINCYVGGGEFGKAADVIEQLKAKIRNVPPSEIINIISGAMWRENLRKAPRLQAQFLFAQAQVQASKDVRSLALQLRQVSTDIIRRKYAEALAISGDWKAALTEFAKVSGTIGTMAKLEKAGTATDMKLGDFWWGYETSYVGAERFFRDRAATFYRKAIAEGQVNGLKQTLVEQRLSSLVLPDVDNSIVDNSAQRNAKPKVSSGNAVESRKPANSSRSSSTVKDPSGLVRRWSFTDGVSASVGDIAPTKPENAILENGAISLRSGSPLVFPAGTVPRAPFTVQVWASASDKGLGLEDDFIFKIASTPDSKDDGVFWTWRARTKWVSQIGAFGEYKAVGHGKLLVDEKKHLYTVVAEKSGGKMKLKFYQDDTEFGELMSKSMWKKPPMLILGGFVTPTYDEVRIYSRALTHAEIIKSVNEGPEKLPELGKGK